MDPGGAQGNGRGILDLEVQVGGRGEDAVVAGGVSQGVADDLADLDGAGLVNEQHAARLACGSALGIEPPGLLEERELPGSRGLFVGVGDLR